ncbi:Altered inheritance of mitochondria protein 6 [Knufia obscura]|uniref:Altered inheritance of mitochondria protein 6 n=1 Tax=Knufia obscura TaxID=1635080 RepID=A0ABR0RA56_9EURO|nr:Altered inheritance of mitochondria protein 6 [Knufia obscura]
MASMMKRMGSENSWRPLWPAQDPKTSRTRRITRISLTYLQWSLLLLLLAGLSILIANIVLIRSIHASKLPDLTDSGVGRLVQDIKAHRIDLKALFTNPNTLKPYLGLDESFTQDIAPIPCHSHNDYWRTAPLFEALSNGCNSVEADIWQDPNDSTNLFVGHGKRALEPERTLQNMYLRPIQAILDRAYEGTTTPLQGVFTTSPTTTLVLLVDFKTPSETLWSAFQDSLAPLREKGYLRTWNETSQSIIPGPLTIVASGDIDFTLITNETTNPHHDIFIDAPLLDLASSNTTYNVSNSYYASSAFNPALGVKNLYPWQSPSTAQVDTLRAQSTAAQDVGLQVRYWDTPAWPVSHMTGIWETLVERVGVDVLNVDDLELASRWDWRVCWRGLWGIC